MKMINWKELFELHYTVFHCETKEQKIELLNIAHDLGYTWITGKSFLKYNYWDCYKERTCYDINTGRYCHIEYWIENNYNVINVSELLSGRKPFKLKRK